MAKITDPVIIENSRELEVPEFSRKDIERLAAKVLEEYGDDVINKAIEEGKIVIPAGFGLIEMDGDEIITQEIYDKLITGKYVLLLNIEEEKAVYYPTAKDINGITLYHLYLSLNPVEGYYYPLSNSDIGDEVITIFDNESTIEFPKGTKWFKHDITFNSGSISIVLPFRDISRTENGLFPYIGYSVSAGEFAYISKYTENDYEVGSLNLNTLFTATSITNHSVTEL